MTILARPSSPHRTRPCRTLAGTITRIAVGAVLVGMVGLAARDFLGLPRVPEGVRLDRGIVYRSDGDRRVLMDLYRPDGPSPTGGWPAVVAIHGGGWVGGSRRDYGPGLARLAQHGIAVAAIDYKLARDGSPTWPGNLDDCREAVRWLRRHAEERAIDPSRIAAMGASAGGHLAALLGTAAEAPGGDPSARVVAVVAFYAPTDLTTLRGEACRPGGPVEVLLGAHPEAVPDRAVAASPARRASSEDAPMLLIHGRHDRLIPPRQSQTMASALAGARVPHRVVLIDGAAHGFGLVVNGRDLLPEILAFLDESWNHTRGRPEGLAARPGPPPFSG